MNGEHETIPIEPLEEVIFQGYSTVPDLHLRWEHGTLGWYDPINFAATPIFTKRCSVMWDHRILAEVTANS